MSTLLTRVAVALVILAATTACGPSSPSEPPPPVPFKPSGKLMFEIGTGEDDFEPVSGGTKVALQSGSQGGQHIWFAARCKGFGSPARLRFGITNAEGETISNTHSTVLPSETDDEGWRVRTGLTAFIDGTAPAVADAPIIFQGRLDDDYGNSMDLTADAVVQGFF